MSFVETMGSGFSRVAVPLISKYTETGYFRDVVKSLLTGSTDQICPCGVLHGKGRNCSSVILNVAKRKPSKLFLAVAVQRQRCRDAAAQIISQPELLSQYSSMQEENRRKKGKRREGVCDDCTTGMYCMDVGDCIPLGRTKSSCDTPDCTPGNCDVDCSPGGCDGCS